MKKKYTKKQIQEAIDYWEKQLKMMNESDTTNASGTIDALQLVADKAGVTIEQLIDAAICKVIKESDILEEAGLSHIEYSSRRYTLFLDFEADVEGHFEDYGIGAYEYWGSTGYDSNVGFEIESGGLDEVKIVDATNAIAEALFGEGAEHDSTSINNDIDPDELIQHGSSTIKTDYKPIYINDVESQLDDILQGLKPYFGKKAPYISVRIEK